MPMVNGSIVPLADNAALGSGQEIERDSDLRAFGCLPREPLLRLLQRQTGAIESLVRPVETGDGLGRESASLETFDIQSVWFRWIAGNGHVRRHVLPDHRAAPGDAVRPDTPELVHGREAAEYGKVADVHVPPERRAVGEYRVTAHLTVVCEVYVRHEPVVVADPRHTDVLRRPAVEGAEFADGVVVADLEPRGLPPVLLVLGHLANGRELEDAVAPPDPGVPGDHGVGADRTSRADLDIRPDDGVGADFDVRRDPRAGVNNGSGVSLHGRDGRLTNATPGRSARPPRACAPCTSSRPPPPPHPRRAPAP